mgnify:FL=1
MPALRRIIEEGGTMVLPWCPKLQPTDWIDASIEFGARSDSFEDRKPVFVKSRRSRASLSRNDLGDRRGAFDSDEFLVEAGVEVGQGVRIEAHLVQDGRVEVLHVESVFDRG